MNDFSYYNPVKVIFGKNALNKLAESILLYGKKIMLVSYENPIYFKNTIELIHHECEKNQIECIDFFKVKPNPLLSDARSAVEIAKNHKIECVVALGGGSVMDSAKVIAAGILYEMDIKNMIVLSHSDGRNVPPTKTIPTIMIPTIPATGSEMNPTAVITDDETMSKSYVWTEAIYPKIAIMDPSLTLSLPKYQTAAGAIDIISHVWEAYVNGCVDSDLEVLDKMQEGVIKATLNSLEKVWNNPNDIDARANLMWEASIGLNGWLTSGTFGFTPMHQLGHVLSAKYRATHGATLACMMLAEMRFYIGKNNKRMEMLAKNVFNTSLEDAANQFEKIIRHYGVQSRISEFGVKPEEIDFLASEVKRISFGPDGMLNAQPKLSFEDVKEIYKIAM